MIKAKKAETLQLPMGLEELFLPKAPREDGLTATAIATLLGLQRPTKKLYDALKKGIESGVIEAVRTLLPRIDGVSGPGVVYRAKERNPIQDEGTPVEADSS